MVVRAPASLVGKAGEGGSLCWSLLIEEEDDAEQEQEELLSARSPRSTAYIPPGRPPRTAPHAPSETGPALQLPNL